MDVVVLGAVMFFRADATFSAAAVLIVGVVVTFGAALETASTLCVDGFHKTGV